MYKQFITVAAIVLMLGTLLFAQNVKTKQYKFELDKRSPIVLNLEGKIVVSNWDMNYGLIKVNVETEGSVLGYSNKDERKEYELMITEKKDTILVEPIERESMFVVGVSTITEEITHNIFLPKDVVVLINTTRGDVELNGSFDIIEVNNEEGNTTAMINQNNLHYLTSNTKRGEIFVNEKNLGDSFKIISKGESIFSLTSYRGDIIIKTIANN